jgi:type I restriction enzyme, S subunit
VNGWREMNGEEIPFSELLSNVVDNRGKTCPTADKGIPLIATNCIRNELLYPTYEKARYVSQETYDTWFRGHPQPGDILFVNKATPGRVCLVPDPVDFCIAQDMVAIRADDKKVYPKFLFALLRSPAVQSQIEQMHVGTLIPHFKKGDFNKLLLPIPDRKLQEFIGDIYFTLSAKIELNRRMNETLEALAQTLFKSWFVDATANGLPEGWRETTLEELAEISGGKQLPTEACKPSGKFPVFGANGIMGFAEKTTHADFVIAFGRVGAYCGSIHWAHGGAWINNNASSVVPNRWPEFVLQAMLNVDFEAMRTGSAQPFIPNSALAAAEVVRPLDDVLDSYCSAVRPMRLKQTQNEAESRTLAGLRDALLPKLLSGELRVEATQTNTDGHGRTRIRKKER